MLFKRLKFLYDNGKLTIRQLENAVEKGWITQDEMNIILGVNNN